MKTKSLIYMVVILILIYVGRIQELIPVLSHLSIGKVAIIIAFFLYIAQNKDEQIKQPIFFSYPQVKYLLIILALAVLSIPGSVWPGKSFNFLISFQLKLLLFVYLLIMIVNKEEYLRKTCLGLSLCPLFLSLAAIINPRIVGDGRVSVSGTYDPNDLALLLVMCLPIMFYLWEDESGIWKHLLLVSMLLSVYVIPNTGSRGGLLAFCTALFAVLIKKGRRRFLQGTVIAVAVGGFFYFSAGGQIQRLMTISDLDSDYNQTAQEGRVQIWERASKLILQKPFLGSGIGAFVTAEGSTHESGKWSAAHNTYIQIGVELGVVGLVAHIWVIWKVIALARQNPGKYSSGIEVAMYAYIVGGMFLSWAFAYLFYFMIGLSLAQIRIESSKTITVGTL